MRTRRALVLSLLLNVILLVGLATAEWSTVVRDVRGLAQRVTPSPGRGANAELAPGDIRIAVDGGSDVHPISPYIYGVAAVSEVVDPSLVSGLGATLNRWGGNSSTRFNWVNGHAWSAAADYQFRNTGAGLTGSVSDLFVDANRRQHMESLITIPAMGWVAKSDSTSDMSVNVPADGGPATGPDGQIEGYDPTPNRERTSLPSLPRKPGPFVDAPDPATPVVYQDEWVNHLVAGFGHADAGGVRFYAVDNEPELWSVTHRDVHPARMGYEDLAHVFEDYSGAIKAVDASASVVGPESWGYPAYMYSGVDRGNDNYATHPDRRAHGDVPFLPWWLRTIRQHDATTGRRSLDVLTVHYYPAAPGVSGPRSDPQTDAMRLRSTGSLWDPTYVDESYIAEPVRLIPRLREWAREYPGTRVGITEYNFGGGDSISAGLAEADALGIFGRENLYLATYWNSVKPRSPAWFAFRMYRNYDGSGGHFGDTSVRATSSSPATVSSFASREPGWIDVMLVNRDPSRRHVSAVTLGGATRGGGGVARYQYSGEALQSITRRPDLTGGSGPVSVDLPPASMTLLRIPVSG